MRFRCPMMNIWMTSVAAVWGMACSDPDDEPNIVRDADLDTIPPDVETGPLDDDAEPDTEPIDGDPQEPDVKDSEPDIGDVDPPPPPPNCTPVSTQFTPPRQLKIATYNLQNLFDENNDDCSKDYDAAQGWNSGNVQKKLSNLARVIADIDADVIGINEVETYEILQKLRDTIIAQGGPEYPYIAYAEGHYKTDYTCQVDIGLMSRYPLLPHQKEPSGRVEPLKGQYQCASGGELYASTQETRPALYAELDLDNDCRGDMIFLVNHWIGKNNAPIFGCTPEDRHKRSAQVIKNWVNSYIDQDSSRPVIIMGDLNSYEDDPELDTFATTDRNSLTELRQLYNIWGEFDLSTPQNATNSTYYYQAGSLWGRLDHIILTANLLLENSPAQWRLQPQSAETFHPSYVLNGGIPFEFNQYRKTGYSDHLPLIIQLERSSE